ncbi:hypothetical protein VMCG_06749 [Cytospora schulzeri]|uniref:Uncharacterized protein n=1 Tax=Cytospora schulzeri TaxID=448051 RepID=A0A423W604_9PEZI|nr:hypothetical protein VMCG_06749 [Valsa malicola]
MDSPAMSISPAESVFEPAIGTKHLFTLTREFVSDVVFCVWTACCGPCIRRIRDMDDEEGSRKGGQTNVDSESRIVEMEASHSGTQTAETSRWFERFIRRYCQPRASSPWLMPQSVDPTDSGYLDPSHLVQHMGGHFQICLTDNPPTLSSVDLTEPDSGENGEGAHLEDEASFSFKSGHLAVTDNVDTTATEPADHAKQSSSGAVQHLEQSIPTQHAMTPGRVQSGQHIATMVILSGTATR